MYRSLNRAIGVGSSLSPIDKMRIHLQWSHEVNIISYVYNTSDMAKTFMIHLQHAHTHHVTKFSMVQELLKAHLSLAFQFKRLEKQEAANLQVGTISLKVQAWALDEEFLVHLPVVVATADIDVEQEMVLYVPATTKKVEKKRVAKDISFDDKDKNEDKKDKKDKKDKHKKSKTA